MCFSRGSKFGITQVADIPKRYINRNILLTTANMLNERINSTNAGYNTKTGGYATFMPDMKKLYAMPCRKILEEENNEWMVF
jgi:hypothetical protein